MQPLPRRPERSSRVMASCLHPSILDYEDRAAESSSDEGDLWSALDEHAIVVVTDWRGVVTFASGRFCAISQYTDAELLGRDHPLFSAGHRCFEELWETIAGCRTWQGEAQFQAKDGSSYWLASTVVPFFDTHGIPQKFVVIHSDITEQKRIEAELNERLSLIHI